MPPRDSSVTEVNASRFRRWCVIVLCAMLMVACGSHASGQRKVFPDSTGSALTVPTKTDEIDDVGFEPFYNLARDPVRLRSVTIVGAPSELRILNVRAYNYKQTKETVLSQLGDLTKECPRTFRPRPISSYTTPPHGASSWFVVIAFTISKPGRYHLGRVRISYTAAGHEGWQYLDIDTTMTVTNPPKPGPTPLPSTAVCGQG